MIRNEKQLKITHKKIRDLQDAIKQLKTGHSNQKDLRLKMQIDALNSDLKALQKETREYERLRSGKVTQFAAHSLEELPILLIKARIARSMTQEDLAIRLGLSEQQIQRYEQNNYAKASLSRIEEIAAALRIKIQEKAILV